MVLWPKMLTLAALVAVRSLFEFEKLEFFTDISKYEMTTVKPNRRGLKTTRSQFELYLNELRINKSLRDNKFDGSDPDILKRTWDQLSEKLNALGGPCRDVNGWKRVICDWKSQTRAKARKLRLAHTQTGNDGVPPKPLTDLEESLLNLTGQVVVTGLANVKEIGIDGPIKPATEVFISKESTIDVANHFEMENGSDDRSRTLSTSSKKKIRTPKKKTSLLGCLEDMAKKNDNEIADSLGVIARELKLRRKIENKKLQLELLKLKLKYPQHDFIFDDSSDSDN